MQQEHCDKNTAMYNHPVRREATLVARTDDLLERTFTDVWFTTKSAQLFAQMVPAAVGHALWGCFRACCPESLQPQSA